MLSCFCGYENVIPRERKITSSPGRIRKIHVFRVNVYILVYSAALVVPSGLGNMSVSLNLYKTALKITNVMLILRKISSSVTLLSTNWPVYFGRS